MAMSLLVSEGFVPVLFEKREDAIEINIKKMYTSEPSLSEDHLLGYQAPDIGINIRD